MNNKSEKNKGEAELAPVCVFGYRRAESFAKTIEMLSRCWGSRSTDLYLYIDGPKNLSEASKVNATYEVAKAVSVDSFRSVNIIRSEENRGLANSIIRGVSETVNANGRVIVLEDDLLPSKNFLRYMNVSLREYESNSKVGSVSAFGFRINMESIYDNYFHPRPTSWGWGTWQDRWNSAVWDLSHESDVKGSNFKKKFNEGGQDLFRMLQNYRKGVIDSWAIRWAYTHYKNGWLASSPRYSFIENMGYGEGGTNCVGRTPPPFELIDDTQSVFELNPVVVEDKDISKQVNRYNSNFYKIMQLVKQKIYRG